jgi:hypothetical protein
MIFLSENIDISVRVLRFAAIRYEIKGYFWAPPKSRDARRYIVKYLYVHMTGPGECTVV